METENVKGKDGTKKIMTFILISGKPDVGKTRVCNRLHGMLGMNGTFKLDGRKHTVGADHLTHYEKGGKHIVINSSSDDDRRMLEFAKYLDDLAKGNVRPDIIVTTIREEGEPMYHMLALLEKVAEGAQNLENYYNQNIANITTFAPKAIKCNAFVLHLERQEEVDEVENEDTVLIPYCDYNADKIKYMIDFVLARP